MTVTTAHDLRWTGTCNGCHKSGVEVESRETHGLRALCDRCAELPYDRKPRLYPGEFEKKVPSATAPMGGGTVAPGAEPPINTGDSGVPPVWHPGTIGTLHRCDVAAMLGSEPEPVDRLIEGVVARGTLTLLAGREKEGKSLLSMAFAGCGVTGGGSIAGIPVEPLRVLVIDAENGERELHRRLRSLGLGPDHSERIEVYEAHGHDLRRNLGEVEALLIELAPDLVVLDSWRSLWGGDENDSGEVARCLDPLRDMIRKRDCGGVLIHHMRKQGGYRGSSAIGASVENVLELSRDEEDDDRRRRRLRNPSCRYEQEANDRWLRIEADRERGLLLVDEAEPFRPTMAKRDDAAADLLAELNGQPLSWSEWATSAGLDPKNGTARRARDGLFEAGSVVRDGDKWTSAPVLTPPKLCGCPKPLAAPGDDGLLRCARCKGTVDGWPS
jgi:KaiC/GvpD/RAD55 family RecA-like ATPase